MIANFDLEIQNGSWACAFAVDLESPHMHLFNCYFEYKRLSLPPAINNNNNIEVNIKNDKLGL